MTVKVSPSVFIGRRGGVLDGGRRHRREPFVAQPEDLAGDLVLAQEAGLEEQGSSAPSEQRTPASSSAGSGFVPTGW